MFSKNRIVFAAALGAIGLALSGYSFGASTVGAASASGSAGSTPAASSPAAAPAASGTVSTDGVCRLVPIATVDSTLGRKYVNSKLVAVEQSTPGSGDPAITEDQLKKLATAVHAAG